MEQIGNLVKSGKFNEPPEIQIIKQFVADKYQATIKVNVHPNQITLVTSNSALAGALRLELYKLQSLAKTDKKLTIRIGS